MPIPSVEEISRQKSFRATLEVMSPVETSLEITKENVSEESSSSSSDSEKSGEPEEIKEAYKPRSAEHCEKLANYLNIPYTQDTLVYFRGDADYLEIQKKVLKRSKIADLVETRNMYTANMCTVEPDTDDEEPKDLDSFQCMELAYLSRGIYKKILTETLKTLVILRQLDMASRMTDKMNSTIYDLE